MKSLASSAAVVALFIVAPLAAAQTVTISEMHLCCKGCTSAVEKAVAQVEGVTCKADQDELSAVLVGDNPKNLQKAIDAIAAVGFFGKIEGAELAFKPIEFKEGEKVHRLEIVHIHNCCRMCTDAIQSAIEDVEGVKRSTLENKKVSFVVEGDFSPAEVVEAIQNAGFYPTLKGREAKKQKQ